MIHLFSDNKQALEIQLVAEIFSSIFIIMMMVCDRIRSENHRKYDNKFMYLVVLINLISDITVITFSGTDSEIFSFVLRAAYILYYLSLFVFTVKLTIYAKLFSDDKRPIKENVFLLTGFGTQILNVILLVISQFTNIYYSIDDGNIYHRGKGIILLYLLCTVNFIYIFTRIIKMRKKKSRLIVYGISAVSFLPFIGMILSYLFYGIGIAQISTTFSLMIIFVMSQKEETIIAARREREHAQVNGKIMISQVQPHFVFNVLNTIVYLCDVDTEKAKDTMLDFAAYLRENFASVNKKEMVRLSDELKHIRKYLGLEKLRFEERLNVEYDIDDIDFSIPTLTIQPLVENAVKHGICKKEEGGTVYISAHENDGNYEIVIRDDGVGFDVNEKITDKPTGINIVRTILDYECNGTLDVCSEIGKGTVCTIKIPKTGESK